MQQQFSWPWVQSQVASSIDLWNQCAAPTRLPGPRFTLAEQITREAAFDETRRAVEREMRRLSRSKVERLQSQRRMTDSFAWFASNALKLKPEAVRLLTNDFLPAGTRFSRLARNFDSTLSLADTIQACRSAWTACGLQLLLGDRLEITPSILGYSLLYPYSDNYLDCTERSDSAKLRFSEQFRARLQGQSPPVTDRT
jgi:hypothetical protein